MICLLALLALFAGAAGAADPAKNTQPVLRAGAFDIDITPPVGLPMWGYGGRKDLPCRGVRDPLEACVVVLELPAVVTPAPKGVSEIANRRVALIGIDAGRAPARATMAKLRARLLAEAGVAHVFVVGSHTHHGPCLELEKVEPTASYIRDLVDKLVLATKKSVERLVPAKFAVGSRELAKHNRNRHTKISPKPVDRHLTVIRLDDLEGKPIATVVNFAAHPTSLPWDLFKYSADYPGALKNRVEKTIGGRCVFLQGFSGDLSTNRGRKNVDEFGEALADEVVAISRGLKPEARSDLLLGVREEDFRFEKMRVDMKEPLTRLKYSIVFFKSLVDAFVEEYEGGVRPNIQVAMLGTDFGFVSAAGEFFCAHAIRLRERARLREAMFLGYCNGYHQYFPTIEAVAEGGYGADKEVSPVEVGAGERMMDRALQHLFELRKKIETARKKMKAEKK